jgi:hypothetical protein
VLALARVDTDLYSGPLFAHASLPQPSSLPKARRTPRRQLRKQRPVPRISISDQGAPKDRTAAPAEPRSASCFEAIRPSRATEQLTELLWGD